MGKSTVIQHCHGKWPFLIGQSPENIYKWAMFHGYVTNYQRVNGMLENISEVPTIYSNAPRYV